MTRLKYDGRDVEVAVYVFSKVFLIRKGDEERSAPQLAEKHQCRFKKLGTAKNLKEVAILLATWYEFPAWKKTTNLMFLTPSGEWMDFVNSKGGLKRIRLAVVKISVNILLK